jgi:hypothetical protein
VPNVTSTDKARGDMPINRPLPARTGAGSRTLSEMTRANDPFLPDRVWPRHLAKAALIALAILGMLVIVGMAVCTGMTFSRWLSGAAP